jgi:hypothetical protein
MASNTSLGGLHNRVAVQGSRVLEWAPRSLRLAELDPEQPAVVIEVADYAIGPIR